MANSHTPVLAQELAFLSLHTGKDEAVLLAQALRQGVDMLYRQTLEETFINGELPRDEAVKKLGMQRVRELEYARQALEQDISMALGI
ncbi:MAG: hypothetical protein GY862_29085 [Gammaproteobacteria bacterium]|nr:hypothetical protein [Gammaproteobacteria bacterium]